GGGRRFGGCRGRDELAKLSPGPICRRDGRAISEQDGFVRIGGLAEVPDGEIRLFELVTGRVAVAHIENELFAFGDECTHEGCSLSEGELDEVADTVVCPCHGSAFALRDGEPVEGPARDRVPVDPVRVRDGWVEVKLEIGGQG